MANETKQTKIGILVYIAKHEAKGCKFEGEPDTWYNPIDEARDQVKPEYKGKTVEIVLEGKNKFSSMTLLDDTKKKIKAEEKIKITEEEVVTEKEMSPEAAEALKQYNEEDAEQEEMGEVDVEGYSPAPISNPKMLNQLLDDPRIEQYTQEVYNAMEKTKLETSKKGSMNLTYASWAEVWGALKRIHPTATYHVHEKEGMPVFYDKANLNMGAFVKVSVTVLGLIHTVHLPVMNFSNKSMKVESITTFDINKAIQRALVKAIALHGMGLYVYKGEDFPSKDK